MFTSLAPCIRPVSRSITSVFGAVQRLHPSLKTSRSQRASVLGAPADLEKVVIASIQAKVVDQRVPARRLLVERVRERKHQHPAAALLADFLDSFVDARLGHAQRHGVERALLGWRPVSRRGVDGGHRGALEPAEELRAVLCEARCHLLCAGAPDVGGDHKEALGAKVRFEALENLVDDLQRSGSVQQRRARRHQNSLGLQHAATIDLL
mmetsp:Transcript_13459/g.21997  ORF Transcript_13459/g.21997 Transcript_13459/m.21997 type:complete len:209 (+) Transcript_13459:842-1468(+)